MKIICVGQSAYDITLPIKGYPIENRKYKIKDTAECGGGSANNMAYLLAKWNVNTTLVSSVGNDNYGKTIKEELESVGVNTDFIETISCKTTISYIINNLENGSRTIITKKDPLMKGERNVNITGDILLFDGNDYEKALNVIKNNPNAIKIIDAGSIKEETINLCKLCDYIVCSNDFARDYTKINFKLNEMDQIKKSYDILARDFSGQVIITLESFGSFTKIDNEYKLVPSIKVNSVDTTGAGDIYHGAFAYFIAHKYNLIDSMHYANIAGALSVTKMGSKKSMPDLSEVINYHE